jgi:hypothetical protein
MASLSYAQKFSFGETIIEILKQNKEMLIEAGLDVDKKLVQLEKKNNDAISADAKQEAMKAELEKATAVAVSLVDDSYTFASSIVDAMVGALGKKDPLSKRLRELRSQMKKSASAKKKEDK